MRLFEQPESVEVGYEEGEKGRQMRFRWRRTSYRVARSEGPERIAPEWWREETEPRDYFRVEDEEGRRYWLYRQASGGETMPRWFLHGVFA